MEQGGHPYRSRGELQPGGTPPGGLVGFPIPGWRRELASRGSAVRVGEPCYIYPSTPGTSSGSCPLAR